MTAVCAWCGAHLGQRPGPADAITHSVCRSCSQHELAKVGIRIERDQCGIARPQSISAASQPDGQGAKVDRRSPDISGAPVSAGALPSRTTAAINSRRHRLAFFLSFSRSLRRVA